MNIKKVLAATVFALILVSYLSVVFGDIPVGGLVVKKVHEDDEDKVVMELDGERGRRAVVPNGEQVTFGNEIDEIVILTITVDDEVTYFKVLNPGEWVNLTMGSAELPSGFKYRVSGDSDITLSYIGPEYGDFGTLIQPGPVGGVLLPVPANHLLASLAPMMMILLAAGLAASRLFLTITVRSQE